MKSRIINAECLELNKSGMSGIFNFSFHSVSCINYSIWILDHFHVIIDKLWFNFIKLYSNYYVLSINNCFYNCDYTVHIPSTKTLQILQQPARHRIILVLWHHGVLQTFKVLDVVLFWWRGSSLKRENNVLLSFWIYVKVVAGIFEFLTVSVSGFTSYGQ